MLYDILLTKIKNFISQYKKTKERLSFIPVYRLSEVIQDDDDSYYVTIQLINKNATFQARPEELLAENDIVNQFSPTDVRTLTYLGYLGINSPKYTVLAKSLSIKSNDVIFTIRKKGEKKPILKTAFEIATDKEFLESIDPKDAHMLGYVAGMEHIAKEREIKEELQKRLQK